MKGWKGLRKGQYVTYRCDGSRELSVAWVIYNDTNNQSISAHSCKSVWSGTSVRHLREYRTSNAEGADIVLEPTEEPVRTIIFYRALVKVVELLQDGRMMQGDASTLSKGGWSFKVHEGETVRAIASALVLEDKLLSLPRSGLCLGMSWSSNEETGDVLLRDTRHHKDYEDLCLGLRPEAVRQRLLQDDAVYAIARPEDLMRAPFIPSKQDSVCVADRALPGDCERIASIEPVKDHKNSNTFTAAQRKRMAGKGEVGPAAAKSLKSENLDPKYADRMRMESEGGVSSSRREAARDAWMRKLEEENYSGPTLDRTRYLALRHCDVQGNPRQTAEYGKMCCEAVGVGDKPDWERYGHLQEADIDPIRWVVARGSGCMWLPDSPRTTVKGFRHRLITKGPPIRSKLFRLNRTDTEWIEKAIQEDVKRGQLEKGSSEWGFPAFPTKENAAYKAIKRARRMVVDYRELNKVTVRKFFLIPNSDYIKSTVAGNELISVGDLKEGFNQVDNEEDTKKKMAVLSAGGCWLPRGLTFGPTNGPEDFQELVFTVFQRRLYKDWFLFVDDLSVATGRPKCHGDGPSGAHDVMCNARETTEGEKSEVGLNVRAGPAFPSPFAHLVAWVLECLLFSVSVALGQFVAAEEPMVMRTPGMKRRVEKEKNIYPKKNPNMSMF